MVEHQHHLAARIQSGVIVVAKFRRCDAEPRKHDFALKGPLVRVTTGSLRSMKLLFNSLYSNGQARLVSIRAVFDQRHGLQK